VVCWHRVSAGTVVWLALCFGWHRRLTGTVVSLAPRFSCTVACGR
jgi:hypothetical protein